MAQERHFGGFVKRMASGGFVPGFGVGDRTPILAEPGEYLILRSLAPSFAPVIEPLRQLGGLRGTVSNVTTNAHTFNFSVSGAGNPQQTVKEIATALRRGVRRGLFELS